MNMSCTLFWSPMPRGKDIGNFQLRDAIGAEFGLPCTVGEDATPFLRGLSAAGIQGAAKLIEAIEKHGEIRLWKEC